MGSLSYTYPLYPWAREWSQYYVYQWHLVENGPPFYLGYKFGPANVRKTLRQIQRIDRVTRGIPKVILLCGWQEYVPGIKATWDTQFPSFVTTSDDFADPSIGPTGSDAIRWLMTEAKENNTLVSFHLDFALAQEHSPLWQKYRDLDLLCRDERGDVKTYGNPVLWEGRVNLQREFDAGLFQERMADFFDTFPEVLNTGCVHNDWNVADDSPWHGYTAEDDVAALRRNAAWLKEVYGVDTFGEHVGLYRPEYDYGMQPLSLAFSNYKRPDGPHLSTIHADPMKVPAYVSCGGHGGEHDKEFYTPGALVFSDESLLFGGTNQGEFGYCYTNDENNPEYGNDLFRDFCYSTLPWYYLNRLLRLAYDRDTQVVMFSEGVRSFAESGKVCITKDDKYIRDGNDLFVPALWKTNREIMAWSDGGYENKTWVLPDAWVDVTSVDTYDNKLEELSFRQTLPVDDGKLSLSLGRFDGVVIVPHGQAPDGPGPARTPSGVMELVGVSDAGTVTATLAGNGSPLHQILDVETKGKTLYVTLYLKDKTGDGQIFVEPIDGVTIERLGKGTGVLVNDYVDGKYITYKLTGRARFRFTRFHFDHFGRADGTHEAGPLPVIEYNVRDKQ